jgi:hypothetical protein
MAADYAGLEARVAELEQQMRHIFPAKIDAVSYAVSPVHEDTRAIRQGLTEHGAMLTEQGALLQEILRRLPAEPGA